MTETEYFETEVVEDDSGFYVRQKMGLYEVMYGPTLTRKCAEALKKEMELAYEKRRCL